MEKSVRRQKVLDQRLALTENDVNTRSVAIQKKLLQSEFWPKSGRVALYSAVKNEVLTFDLFKHALEQGLEVYFPRVEMGIHFYQVNGPEDLHRGSWMIPEPKQHCEPLPEGENLDLMLVPGVAFSKEGFRIGYGKGFYDKAISELKTKTVGLAYDFQMVEAFAFDPWDQKLDAILTEKNSYKFRKV